MTDEVPGVTQEERDVLHRLHMDEPVELTNVHAKAASHALRGVQEMAGDLQDRSQQRFESLLASIQIHALLALTQEVKNLRLAMYPTSGEST